MAPGGTPGESGLEMIRHNRRHALPDVFPHRRYSWEERVGGRKEHKKCKVSSKCFVEHIEDAGSGDQLRDADSYCGDINAAFI